MTLEKVGHLQLPAHEGEGGFDHAAINQARGRLYVAHTANDTVDVVDLRGERYLRSLSGLKGVAGVLVDPDQNRLFTSNRGEDTVSIFSDGGESTGRKVSVGVRPNGLAHAPGRELLLVGNVGDPKVPNSYTISIIGLREYSVVSTITVPDRTRWAIYDGHTGNFYVNVRDPPQIAVIRSAAPESVSHSFPVPRAGPHGLDLDERRRRLFCACDEGRLVAVQLPSGEIVGECGLSGAPDVIFHNPDRDRLYVAVGDPGVIDVIDTRTLTAVESVRTGPDAHTLALDSKGGRIYSFLPESHQALILQDS